ncbi:SWIM zinc finger family protein [Halopelagius longus]|uniref:SWIM-type domain-containing protein n=1 Tax=Halopelagius longus TaxID=1236180 RepID=A0A1H1EC68_9EURY|nr:SWIM zinc finger family protein [Halopelagius longus]SDQ86345.1 hypothetical protein SAMN05216278_2836 [Halopelagius longus]
MTHTRNTPASNTQSRPRRRAVRQKTTLPASGFVGRARRAREDPMAVRPLRDGRYVVETEGGTYVVDSDADTCTCPDSAIRDARCKHLRRVHIEIADGLVPAPDQRTAVCAVCGNRTYVPRFDSGPVLCDRHDHASGDLVRDRETKNLLVVLRATGDRADEARTDSDRTVADYDTNDDYGSHEPVFEAVYVESVPLEEDIAELRAKKRYLFPASRLVPVEPGFATEEVRRTLAGSHLGGESQTTQATLRLRT